MLGRRANGCKAYTAAMLQDPTLRTGYLVMLALPVPAVIALVLVFAGGWPLWAGLLLLAALDSAILSVLFVWARRRRAR
jgi:membrane protein implicated in regulation of membrane protease activity